MRITRKIEPSNTSVQQMRIEDFGRISRYASKDGTLALKVELYQIEAICSQYSFDLNIISAT